MRLAQVFGVVIMLFLFQLEAEAQPPMGNFTVKGKVFETESNQPLEYVNVVLYSMRDSSLISGTITRKDGSFEIKSKRPGGFYLTADFIGYEKYVVSKVMLKPGSETFNTGVISLKQSNVGIEEVEVVGERPFVSYKIDKKVVEVARNPLAQGGTAVDALENVPSIETDMEGNVSVRGSSNFTVLIDGRQSPLSGSDALTQIPASAIDKIEIITNPSVKYDPDGTAGIINVVTKKGKLKGHSLVLNTSVGNSPMASTNLNYTYRFRKATVYAGIGYRDFNMDFNSKDDRETVDSLEQSTFIYTNRKGGMEHGSSSIKAGLDYFVSDANTLSLGVNYNTFKFGRSFNSQIENIQLDTGIYQLSETGFKVKPKSWQVNIGDKHVFGGKSDHYLTVDFTYQKRDGDSDDMLSFSNAENDWSAIADTSAYKEKALTIEDAQRVRLEVNYSLPISDKLFLESGYTLRMDNSDKEYMLYDFDKELNDYLATPIFSDYSSFSRNINAVWALAKGEMFGFGYSFGLRGEHTNRVIEKESDTSSYKYDYLGWYPSAALSKEWGKGNTLQFSFSKRINRPRDHHLNPFEHLSDGYTAFRPNPELEPEYASSYELNFQKSWGRQFIAIETFYHHTENEMDRIFIVESDSVLVRTIENVGENHRLGSELAGNISLWKWWAVNPVASIYYYKLDGEYNEEETVKSSVNSRFSLTNNFTVSSKTRIQLMGNYRGPSVTIDGDRDAMYWASAAVRHSFFDRKLSAVLRVDDIFSTRKRSGTTVAWNPETKSTTYTYSEGYRKGPMVILSLSLKLNQTNDRRNGRRSDENGDGGGMDMDF